MMLKKMGLYTLAVLAGTGLIFGNVALAQEHTGDPFPLEKCPVMGSDLGSKADTVVYEHEGREIRFCCENCVEKFEGDAEAYLEEIDASIIENQLAAYPMEACIHAGTELDENAVNFVVGNRLFRTCCNNCAAEVKDNPEPYFEKLDQAVIDDQSATYALETCPISGQELGSMGDPVEIVVANRLVKLCCAGCKKGVENDPVGTLEKVDAARES